MRKENSEYDQDAYTPYIPYDCWWRIFWRWRYAEHISRPLNIHCKLDLPLDMDGRSQIKFQKSLVDQVKKVLPEYGVEPYYILNRHSDPVNEQVGIDLLIHSPVELIDCLRQEISKWEYVIATHTVDHIVEVRSDGKTNSTFLRLFAAISPELARETSNIPHQLSGPILGSRTEFSENLVDKIKRRKI